MLVPCEKTNVHFKGIRANFKTMITQYISFSVSIVIISWMVGILSNEVLRKTKYYKNLLNLNLIKSKTVNKIIGLGIFKWIVKNTFFKYLNQKLTLKNKIEIAELDELRKEMTIAEINHLIGFGFATIFALVKFINGEYLFGSMIMMVNILLNLYPSLLQQENKRRIDKFTKRYS